MAEQTRQEARPFVNSNGHHTLSQAAQTGHALFHDRVALLIGQATTLGYSLAAALSQQGIDIVLVYTGEGETADESLISQTRRQVEQYGRRCLIFWGQPANATFAQGVMATTLATFGRLDIVISYSVPLSTLPAETGGETRQQGVVPNLPLLRLALSQIVSTQT
jgi:hypothetical protein